MSTAVKERLLLHICCAPCATYPFSVLRENYAVTAYFYDPNIHPESEYQARLAEAKKYFADKCELIEGAYDTARWHRLTRGHADAPERGSRCKICYAMRLGEGARFAAEHDFPVFTSVLAVSPHKDARLLAEIGEKVGAKQGVRYLAVDWKKQGGAQLGIQLAREAALNRQDYCGCVYSLRDRDARLARKAQLECGC